MHFLQLQTKFEHVVEAPLAVLSAIVQQLVDVRVKRSVLSDWLKACLDRLGWKRVVVGEDTNQMQWGGVGKLNRRSDG